MGKRFLTLVALFACFALLCGIWGMSVQYADAKDNSKKERVNQRQGGKAIPIVLRSINNDTTKIPLRDMKPLPFPTEREEEFENRNRVLPKALNSIASPTVDTVCQKSAPSSPNSPPTFQNFEGSPNNCGCFPPDTNGDVGPNNYVQIVNVQYQVFDKSG